MRIALRLFLVLLFFGSTIWFGFATYRDYSMLMYDAVEEETDLQSKDMLEMETRTQKAVSDQAEDESRVDDGNVLAEEEETLRTIRKNKSVSRHYIRLIGNGVAFAVLFTITGFGFAHQAGDFLRFDLGKKIDYVDEVSSTDEMYEKAEYQILKGKHVAGIELLRKVLVNDPDHFEAQLRIAEVYDKDLNNFEAAANEYSLALKHEFHPERWSWAAVRLCNIYSGKLKDSNSAIRMMRQLVEKHPHTGGAAKVRKRLDMIDAHMGKRR